jgi:hypothetical protein
MVADGVMRVLERLNRKLSFEVMVLRDQRWTIDCVCEREDLAMGAARKALNSGKVQAARIVQFRTMPIGGFTTSKVIFEEQAPAKSMTPIAIHDAKGDQIVVCETMHELFEPPSRRMMAIIMREYFTRFQITPTELLHGWTHVKKLQDNGSVQVGAIHRAGSAQARTAGAPSRERINKLEAMIDGAARLARDFAAERKKIPHYDGSDLGTYSDRLRERVGDAAHAYTFRSMLTAWLYDQRSLAGRLEVLLELATETLPWPIMQEIDGVIADILCFGEVIQELFGGQANMGRFLIAVADVLNGHPNALSSTRNPQLLQIAVRLQAGRLPQSFAVLSERLQREIGSDKALDRNDPGNDVKLIDLLIEHMRTADGRILGGEKTEKVLSIRKTRLRQQMLRQMGLDTIAENLRPEQL